MRYQPLSASRSTPDAIIAALAEGGVEFVLGMPGGLTLKLWRALHNHPSIRAVQVHEESIGALMAEAYGRITGRPAVVMGQGEWIVGNAGQAYMEALLGSSPLVILTEMTDGGSLSHHAPYQSGTGDYGTWDARGALAGVTKRVMVSLDPAQAVQHTQLALKHAVTGQPGPVAVVFHSGALGGEVGPQSSPAIYPTQAYTSPHAWGVDQSALGAVVEALHRSERPVILAGNGVRLSQAKAELEHLARVIDAPVATTSSGKGVFAEMDPLGVGVIGRFGWPTANTIVGDADLVLAIGTKLGASDTMNEDPALLEPARQTMMQIEVEPLNASWTYPMDHVLLGDAKNVMRRLADEYESTLGRANKHGRRRVEVCREALPTSASVGDDQTPLNPRTIVELINRSLPDRAVITCDAGENRLFMMQWYSVKPGGEYLQPAAGGGMGYAIPAAMAARLAGPDRAVLAVCGDGGFEMSLHALSSVLQERLPIAVVVLNNAALGWVLHGMGEEAVAARFEDRDYARIARSLGCDGIRAESASELEEALRKIGNLTVPLVIDVPTSLSTTFNELDQTLLRKDG